jgi:acylphosphatase
MANSNGNDHQRIHMWVTGRVQGVGFRAFVQETGVRLGLTGWVRNLGYDRVETVAEGPLGGLEKFEAAVKTGPHVGRVDETKVEWETAEGEFKNFHIKYSL